MRASPAVSEAPSIADADLNENGQPPGPIERQRALLEELMALVVDRAKAEARIENEYQARKERAEEEFDADYQDVIVRFASEKETVEREFHSSKQTLQQQLSAESAAVESEYTSTRDKTLARYSSERGAAKSEFQEARWTITAVYEGVKNGSETQLKETQRKLNETDQRLKEIRSEVAAFLVECRQPTPTESVVMVANTGEPESDPTGNLNEEVEKAEDSLDELKALKLPRYFKGDRLFWLAGLLWFVVVVPLGFILRDAVVALLASAAVALVLGIAISVILYSLSRSHVRHACLPLFESLAHAEMALSACRIYKSRQSRKQMRQNRNRYKIDLKAAADRYQKRKQALRLARNETMRQIVEGYQSRRQQIKKRRTQEWHQIEERYRNLLAQIQDTYERDWKRVHESHERRQAELNITYERDWSTLAKRWHEGLAQSHAGFTAIRQETDQIYPAWETTGLASWTPPAQTPAVVRFGEFQVDLEQLPGGQTESERLKPTTPMVFSQPALLPFPHQSSVLIRTPREGRGQALSVLQGLVYRWLTTLPAGKVRLTIIDPVGLGQSFASMMLLADYDELLVTNRIWTEPAHIEQRLADLTAHMENVIQKYLRNQFPSIEAYNLHAGEVAEPYRLLVVADFPTNFSTEASRRLLSILHSGARCGVYTLLAVDTDQALPLGIKPNDLAKVRNIIDWEDEKLVWRDAMFQEYPLELDAPPSDDTAADILRLVGERAKQAKRVEVAFEFVMPPQRDWWAADSRQDITVALGRAGATKRQSLRLGHGTAQHALIAGKTGSGKSTLLHGLVTNLALTYSPSEVQLYLVDFKKGVEFKAYATHRLPHARVVAIESEREFGLSVLQRLDEELRQRGELLRAAGVQDLRSYRQQGKQMPRILLIVDEFQEFFVEDDRLAQEAALLLDRLVRQGRAFGLHVLLGSQTLGGAYSLARSTIDQMAVRIALQCSEADAHLILSEDNGAARLLSRPGEAIYNDANGLVEGNNPFQVVWLGESQREDLLDKIQRLASEGVTSSLPEPIIFEGNAPADIATNPALHDLLACKPDARPRFPTAWLGDAIAIKDPTATIFRPQSGSNLLVVGQSDDGALGIMAAAFSSLFAQAPRGEDPSWSGPLFYLVEGSTDETPEGKLFAQMAQVWPERTRLVGRRELGTTLVEIAQGIDKRLSEHPGKLSPVFVFVHGLQRFRDLRREEDDFSFSKKDEPPSPAKLFGHIVREGPAARVHAIVWCDSWNNLTRAFERQTLREFELRVLFQMSTGDSSNLIDSPLASRLGIYRAYFHSEEEGRLEKFRPYGVPSQEWLAQLAGQAPKPAE